MCVYGLLDHLRSYNVIIFNIVRSSRHLCVGVDHSRPAHHRGVVDRGSDHTRLVLVGDRVRRTCDGEEEGDDRKESRRRDLASNHNHKEGG